MLRNSPARRSRSAARRQLTWRFTILPLLVAFLLPACAVLPAGGGYRVPSEEPVPSETALQPTPRGAVAFGRYWFEMINWSMASGDTGGLRELSSDACENCALLVKNITLMHDGGTVTGGMMQVHSARVIESTRDGVHWLKLDITEQQIHQVTANGTERTGDPPQRATAYLRVWHDGTSWRVVKVEIRPPEGR